MFASLTGIAAGGAIAKAETVENPKDEFVEIGWMLEYTAIQILNRSEKIEGRIERLFKSGEVNSVHPCMQIYDGWKPSMTAEEYVKFVCGHMNSPELDSKRGELRARNHSAICYPVYGNQSRKIKPSLDERKIFHSIEGKDSRNEISFLERFVKFDQRPSISIEEIEVDESHPDYRIYNEFARNRPSDKTVWIPGNPLPNDFIFVSSENNCGGNECDVVTATLKTIDGTGNVLEKWTFVGVKLSMVSNQNGLHRWCMKSNQVNYEKTLAKKL